MTGYPLDAALAYLERGWNPVPLLSSGKGVVPKGFTGYSGAQVTEADSRRWAAQPHRGLCVRLWDEVGIDVDYHDKPDQAAATLKKLTLERGPRPLTVRVSARYTGGYDGISGTCLYRLPPAYAARRAEPHIWITGWPGVDVIRFGHRQQNVWPTPHHTGRRYGWLWEDDPAATVKEEPLPPAWFLPVLPEAWCEAMIKPPPKKQAGGAISIADVAATADGSMCRAMTTALTEITRDGSRHDGWALRGTLRIARLAEQGHTGGAEAITALRGMFVTAVTADNTRSRPGAEHEFDKALGGITLAGLTPDTDKRCCGSGQQTTIAGIRDQLRRTMRGTRR